MRRPLTPEQRSLRSSIAAYTRWSRTDDTTKATAPARKAFMARFERAVDPEGTLSPDDRARRAEAAMKAHFKAMALASSKNRARRLEAAQAA